MADRDWANEIRSVQKLDLASMSIGKTVKSERTAWYKVGKRIAVYSYNTYLYAYMDLSELKDEDVEVDPETHTIRLHLPAVKTEVAGRDMELKKEYENIAPLRSNLDSKERSEMKEKANTSLMKELESNPEFATRLKEEGRTKARIFFQELAAKSGYTAEVTIDH